MQIEHVAFNIADPVAFAAWYGAHLGMKTVRKIDEAPFTHFIADDAGRTVLEVYHHTKAPVPDYRATDPLVVHIAFKTADLAKDMARLLDAGATPAADVAVTPAGDEMVFLRDPWGLTIQLVRRAKPLL